jgi:hypothetical protein
MLLDRGRAVRGLVSFAEHAASDAATRLVAVPVARHTSRSAPATIHPLLLR